PPPGPSRPGPRRGPGPVPRGDVQPAGGGGDGGAPRGSFARLPKDPSRDLPQPRPVDPPRAGRRAGSPGGKRGREDRDRARDLLLVPTDAERALKEIGQARRRGERSDSVATYKEAMQARSLVDFDDLLLRPLALLQERSDLAARYRERYRWISVDEYQDIDALQYALIRQLAPPDGNLCAIGDPDQSIYGFRGADVGFFLRFRQDWPAARV